MLYFLLFLGGLIFFHELGHFLAARLVGVTVLRFSIGFGPKLVGFKHRGTEYWISLLPLGGYVKFLGDDPEEPPPPSEQKKGFLTTDTWRKVLIVLAGPVFNLVLPLLVFLPMYLGESTLPPAVLGTAATDGPAWQAGLRPGDKVTAIDGQPVKYWWEMLERVTASPGRPLEFRVERDGVERTHTVTPRAVEVGAFRELGLVDSVGRIEVAGERDLPVLMVLPGSPAAAAGIRDFDVVRSVDGKTPASFDEVRQALQAARERPVRLTVAATLPDQAEPAEDRTVTIGPLSEGTDPGITDGEFVISSVEPGSPADRAGLKTGDRIVAMDGRPWSDWSFLVQALAREPAQARTLTIDRDGATQDVTLSLLNPSWAPGAAIPKYEPFGARNRHAAVYPDPIPNEDRVRYALNRSWNRTKEIFVVTVAGIAGLVTGRVSVKEMGGPIMIYDIANKAGERGWTDFFGALAWLSMSLGVLNLLPIPVLDGGHLVLFGIEAVRRKPLGRKGRQIASYFGLAFLLLLMVVVFANDFERKFGALSQLQ